MPRGAPDYSNVRGTGTLEKAFDLAELAARLGSLVCYDRSGLHVWSTDFEKGLQGSSFGSDHEDSTGVVTVERAFSGAFSIKMNPRDDADSYVTWGRIIHYVEEETVGVEVSVSLDSHPESIRVTVIHRDGERALTGILQYDTESKRWRVYDHDDGWVTVLEDFGLQTGAGAWHPIKLVVDVKGGIYVRAMASKHIVQLSDYKLSETPDEDLGQLEIRAITYGSAARHACAYFDNIIVTQKEP